MMALRYDEICVSANPIASSIPVATHKTLEPLAMPHDDDHSLIQRVAAKDRHAFEAFYRRYYPRLFGYLMKIVKRPEIVEEVINDVMVVVWTNASRFNYSSRLSTWVFGIAHNKALKALQRVAEKPVDLPSNMLTWHDPDDPERTVGRQELRRVLAEVLQALSPDHRAVVELTFYHGFSYPEIAEIMDCPVNTVKTRMFHARKRLEELLPRLGIGRSQA